MSKTGRPTVKDVAEMAGVSPSTVSLVLQSKGNLPEQTRARVLKAIGRTGYERPKGRRYDAGIRPIGVIADDIENPYYGELFKSIDDAMDGQNMVPLLLSSNGSVKRQSFLLDSVWNWGFVAAILIPASGSGGETLDHIGALKIPVVLGIRHLGFGAFDYVGPNYFQGMQMATRHLIDLGHRRIAFVGGESDNTAYSERLGGFRMTMSSAASLGMRAYEIQGPMTSQFGVEAMIEIMAMEEPPTALIAYNDQLAFGLMSAASDAGMTPGEDIAIIGFDDIRASALRNVPLTTVSTPPYRIGFEMARLLKSRIKDPSSDPVNIIPPPELKVRMSCGAHRGPIENRPAHRLQQNDVPRRT
ncbi:MAG: LacI family DNA-binding transcriptional regulator [Alphaproteobacteria bacterium]